MTKTILHIDASARTDGSVSRAASAAIVANSGATRVIRRDLAAGALPQVDAHWVTARMIALKEHTAADTAKMALSDALIAEIEAADTIVIGLPIYNFGLPAALKAWLDLIARPGVTFRYTASGPQGLLSGKKVIVAVASGGTPIGAPMDFATPHLNFVLGFVGLSDVSFVWAPDVTQTAEREAA